MQSDKMNDLRMGIEEELKKRLHTLGEHAEHFAHRQVEGMVAKGEAIELTEDEERMLKTYRDFRAMDSCGTFSWDSPEETALITELPDPVLVRDPRDVSA